MCLFVLGWGLSMFTSVTIKAPKRKASVFGKNVSL